MQRQVHTCNSSLAKQIAKSFPSVAFQVLSLSNFEPQAFTPQLVDFKHDMGLGGGEQCASLAHFDRRLAKFH
jgi:hypothetical protein